MARRAQSAQLPLALRYDPDLSEKSFIVTEGSELAFRACTQPERWPAPVLALIGAEGTGKTHLAHIWARACASEVISLRPDSALSDVTALAGVSVLVENADAFDNAVLFALINAALSGEIDRLLLTSRHSLEDWSVHIPDLRSRLNAITVMHLGDADDAALRLIYKKLFADFGLRVGDEAIATLVTHGARSVSAARDNAAALEALAAQRGVKISRQLVAEFLGQQGELFED